ncbi:hypothetical protein E2562_004343 [Oryza meyeriana var. granulata]|uniref:Protein kinase domain-containing protein n=1 Tax=Oryza meyeriana var. granulata TaxID=110450 RepID=A0A6G1BS83_9ORYZ|nr:hypothetical protein E2562_004343 [Oryza meyeriana var. granulata]
MIGQGGFGDVYEGQLPNGRRVAVKRLKQSRLTKKAKQDFAREVEVMGYTAHEYASQGNLTLKCDVYSFGVVLLEVISGKKNSDVSSFFHHAWESWKQHDIVEDLLDSAVSKPEPEELVLALDRCVQIGLLCVQQYPDDRPTMAQVVDMLNSCISQIAMPKKPMVNGGGTRPTFSHVLRGHPDTESASGDRPGPSHS